MDINVIIADDHAIIREGLKSLLEKRGVKVLDIAENGREAVEKTIKYQPDVVIMDISMPDLNGVEATIRIKDALPDARIIALSMHSSKHVVDNMFSAGASGYMLKDSAFNELFEAIQEVIAGNCYLTSSIARMCKDNYGSVKMSKSGCPEFKKMSKKEREVLQLVAEGGKTRDIAEKLHVSVKTVESHRRNLMKKLNIFTIAGLTRFALKEGITSLD